MPARNDGELETFDLPAPSGPQQERFHLLVVKEGSSSVFPLPHVGVVTIGRAPESDLSIDDGSISRQHARLVLSEEQLRVSDLGSRNGTLVNGQPIEGTRPLIAGDVIQVGTVTLVLQGGARARPERTPVSVEQLRRRLAEELERAWHYERPTAVLALDWELPPARPEEAVRTLRDALRLHDLLAWSMPGQLLVLLPELGEEEARLVGAELLTAGPVRAGLATCPTDGADAGSLLMAARAAASATPLGEVRTAAALVTRLELGAQTLVIADPAMLGLYGLIQRLAATDLPVLITGETGTGKEFAAMAVHHHSPRRSRPFIVLNCAALPEALVESELFGHERGAFTGAVTAKTGLLEAAAGGTVFLDELGELSPASQARLLRAVESRRITRLGEVRERSIDVRIVAATNRDLQAEVKAGRFRQDLLFRLGAATVALPPLRDRPREISVLARAFLEEACGRLGRAPIQISVGALQRLVGHPWPGNVRELRNLMAYLAATLEGPLLEPWHLPEESAEGRLSSAPTAVPAQKPPEAPATFRKLEEELRELERRRMVEALQASGGVQKRAAQLIGMPLRTFVLKVKQYGLNKASPAPP